MMDQDASRPYGPEASNSSISLNKLMMKVQTGLHGLEFPLVSVEVVGLIPGGVLCVCSRISLFIPHSANSGSGCIFF